MVGDALFVVTILAIARRVKPLLFCILAQFVLLIDKAARARRIVCLREGCRSASHIVTITLHDSL